MSERRLRECVPGVTFADCEITPPSAWVVHGDVRVRGGPRRRRERRVRLSAREASPCEQGSFCLVEMTLIALGSQTARRSDAASQPPDVECNICHQPIGSNDARFRCAHATCDDVHLCKKCCGCVPERACPTCGARRDQLHCERASPFVLRSHVFEEAFSKAPSTSAVAVVHPRVMIQRAFKAYEARPLLGEPIESGVVHW